MSFKRSNLVGDRQYAADILVFKLSEYRNTNTLLVCTRSESLTLGIMVARELNLPLKLLSCRPITDPADEHKTIGSVSHDELILGNVDHSVPQSYISHKVEMIRHDIVHEEELFNGRGDAHCFSHNTVIVIDEAISSIDSVIATIVSLSKVNRPRIVVAVPVITDEAFRQLSRMADEIIFLNKITSTRLQEWFPVIDRNTTRSLFLNFNLENEGVTFS